jgi:hypothetical protein
MQFTIGQARYGHGIAAPSASNDLIPVAAANDNSPDLIRNGLLRAALRHFAEHGLGAAELAQRNAEQAFFAGNRKEYRHWLDICRALDQRMAEALAFRQDARG